MKGVVCAARELGIPTLTLYAFSAQNWKRPRLEVAHLMSLLRKFVQHEGPPLMARGIRLVTIGELERLPRFVRVPLATLVRASAGNAASV